MIFFDQHLEFEVAPVINCGELQNNSNIEYRVLTIGDGVKAFITNEQAELLFDELDKKLHPGKTYSDIQDERFNYETDLQTANEIIDMYQDNEAI